MQISTQQEYTEAATKIHRLADAQEGTPEAAEMAKLVAAVRNWSLQFKSGRMIMLRR